MDLMHGMLACSRKSPPDLLINVNTKPAKLVGFVSSICLTHHFHISERLEICSAIKK